MFTVPAAVTSVGVLPVAFTTSDPGVQVSQVTDNQDGTYSATLTAQPPFTS